MLVSSTSRVLLASPSRKMSSAVLSWLTQARQPSPCAICSYCVAPRVEGSIISDKKGSTPTNLLCDQRIEHCLGYSSCFDRATAQYLGGHSPQKFARILSSILVRICSTIYRSRCYAQKATKELGDHHMSECLAPMLVQMASTRSYVKQSGTSPLSTPQKTLHLGDTLRCRQNAFQTLWLSVIRYLSLPSRCL